MQIPSERSVLGDFGDRVFQYFGESTRFWHGDRGYEVETQGISRGPRGSKIGKQSYDVKYAFGVDPLQQYLVDIGNGHLQALPFAYDTRPKERGGGRWYHLHPGEHIQPGDELHWSAPAYNWNKNCADCHSTDLHKNYDADTDRYDTQYAEISVGCEACHGPASRHIEQAERHAFDGDKGWSRRFSTSRERRWQFAEGKPIAELAGASTPGGRERSASAEVEACAPCHARRSDLGGRSADFNDRYRVELLDENLYFADGQIRDEVFEYGSFVQSKMYAAGVVCSDCHEPHAGTLRESGNALCGRCHSATTYDTPRHHLHQANTPGSECVECHMPARTYMGIDERRDHRLGLPRPDLSRELDLPNACTSACHQSERVETGRAGNDWAKAAIETNFGKQRPKTFARALHAARHVRLGGENQLLEVVGDKSFPAIARATALLELRAYPQSIDRSLAGYARDPSPLIRRALVQLVANGPDPALEDGVARALLSDEVRSVRLESVRALLDVPKDIWSDADRNAFDRARAELEASLEANGDRPEALLELVRLGLSARGGKVPNKATAEAEPLLERALALDPTFAGTYLAWADFLRAQGRDDEAVDLLKRGIDKAGDRASLEHALGLTQVRLGDKRAALEHLRRAHDLAPSSVRMGFVYAVALHDAGERRKAIALLERLHARFDGDPQVLGALTSYRAETQDQDRTRVVK
jgi:predicted CXXCH cytochrome family protein